jgi:hypothetical protein
LGASCPFGTRADLLGCGVEGHRGAEFLMTCLQDRSVVDYSHRVISV